MTNVTDRIHKFKNLIKVIVDLSNRGHYLGLLSLEDDYLTLQPFLLKKGIEIIFEGYNSNDLKFIINNYIQTGQYSEDQLLERLIIRQGLVSIKEGEWGEILFEKLLSMLGENFFEDFDYSLFDESQFQFLGNNSSYNPSISEISYIFKGRIMELVDSKEMEKLVREVGIFNMALALKGVDDEVASHVKGLISMDYIKDEIDHTSEVIGPCTLRDVSDAQEFILVYLKCYKSLHIRESMYNQIHEDGV